MEDTKLDNKAELKAKFLEYYKELPVQKLAGESIGRDEDTICRWKKEDTEFADQISEARAEWAKRLSKGVRSKEWLLERVIKDHFSPRQEVTGADGSPLVIIKDAGSQVL
jgi:hypothetical protein